MRGLWMLCVALLLTACGPDAEGEGTAAPDSAETMTAVEQDMKTPDFTKVKERYCASFKSERYCPKNVCVWHPITSDAGTTYACGTSLLY